MIFSADRLKNRARELGFNLVGVTRAEPSPQLAAYFRWIDAGMHGEMGYMARADRQARRRDLRLILPGAESMVVVGLDYHSGVIPEAILTDPARGRIAAYAWGLDYHEVMLPRLEALAEWMGRESRITASNRVYVDTGAILERSHGQEAGLGFTGKNTMLIHPRRGSTFFLGEILTDLVFDNYDQPGRATMCGRCTRCLTACPTDAFPQPHVLDARLCISYLTIEHKGAIDPALRPLMGNWIYGCDICQDVCPFQRFAPASGERNFYPPDTERAAPRLVDMLEMDENAFRARYAGSAIARIKRERLVRNACIAAGNWGGDEAVEPLSRLLALDKSPLVRGHAAWALGRIGGGAARAALARAYAQEPDSKVREEILRVIG